MLYDFVDTILRMYNFLFIFSGVQDSATMVIALLYKMKRLAITCQNWGMEKKL